MFAENWQSFLENKKNIFLFIGGIIYLAAIAISISFFFGWNEARPGVRLADPVLALFTPVDLTWFTFIILYGTLGVMFLWLLSHPRLFTLGAYGYALLITFRMITMYLVPLDPPLLIIPLEDPFIAILGGGATLQKDLFFSGHTGSAFFFYLLIKNRFLKYFMLCVTVLIGTFVLLQHVHYSIDVFSAPFFTYVTYKIVEKFIKIEE